MNVPLGVLSAVYAAVRLLEYRLRVGRLGERADALPRVVAGDEWRPHCPDGLKRQIVEEVRQELLATGRQMTDVDGVKEHFGSLSWALVRAANTEPALRIRVVGPTAEVVAQREEEVAARVRRIAARFDVTL